MKFLFAFVFISTVACAKTLPVSKSEMVTKKEVVKNKALEAIDKKTEDCDDKAKKPIEIKPESISLTGNTGCSLDEAKP